MRHTQAVQFNRLETEVEPLLSEVRFFFENPGQIKGLSTGLKELDTQTTGLERQELIYLAARPGMGKSALATNIGDNVAEALLEATDGDLDNQKDIVLVCSQEMSAAQINRRRASRLSGVSFLDLKRGFYFHNGQQVRTEKEKYIAFANAYHSLKHYPMLIHSGRCTTKALSDSVKQLQDDGFNVRLLIDDYLGLHTDTLGADNEVIRLGHISAALAGMKLDLNIPIIALHQLNRGVESRENKEPGMSDLRGSGNLEQDADSIWFLMRPEYYASDLSAIPASERGLTYLNIAKARNGEPGKIKLHWNGRIQKFTDWGEQ
jgi:replicative DNA helicase